MNIRLLVSTFSVTVGLSSALLAQTPAPVRVKSLTGNIVQLPKFHSKVLGNDRNVAIYLPPDYEKSPKRRYPVLYMHDGQNIFDGMTSYLPNREWRADEAAEALIKAKLIEPIIIVGIDNAGMDRANEYLPTKMRMGRDEAGGRADKYGEMILKEIKPMIDSNFRTKRAARDTGLCGSSFGGIITLYLGITHPEAFGKLGVVSPSIWWDNRVMVKKIDALVEKPNVKVWMDIGTAEGDSSVPDTEAAVEALTQKGFALGKDLAYFVDKGAAHNEDAWAGRIGMILMFLYPAK